MKTNILTFKDPVKWLKEVIRIRQNQSLSHLSERARNFRKNELETYREGEQAAILCVLLMEANQTHITFAKQEEQNSDIDIILRKTTPEDYLGIQLKEAPPSKLNPTLIAEDDIINKINKYRDVTIAYYLNRNITGLNVQKIYNSLPESVNLFLFGSNDKKNYFLMGPKCNEFLIKDYDIIELLSNYNNIGEVQFNNSQG